MEKTTVVLIDFLKLAVFSLVIFMVLFDVILFVPVLLTILILLAAVLTIIFAYYANNWKKKLRVGVSALEFCLICLAFFHFYTDLLRA